MKKTVRIYGLARNLIETPKLTPEELGKIEVWISNNTRDYYIRLPRLRETDEWTRWFNLHSTEHMQKSYPKCYAWYGKQAKPIYLREVDPNIPSSRKFPRKEVQDFFGGSQKGSPGRFFTCSVCWLIALAIMEGFERIELWGFVLRDKPHKPHECYKFERPCFFYWVKRARDLGIEVTYQKEVEKLPFAPGDPAAWDGPLYGYCTNEPFAPDCE